jgi:uncharacterized protein YjbI with pentapeptide repeats
MPLDLDSFERSLNDAAARVLTVWLSWLTFALYLAIAAGSVTHEMLLLEKPIKLPVLNVDLPIVAFFAVSPLLFVTFQFYFFLQLISLIQKIETYNDSLRTTVPSRSERQLMRQHLDSFFFVQLLAGPDREQHGLAWFLLRFVAWVTIVIIPLALLLLIQVTFLPYHLEWVCWLHRIVILIDVVFVWSIWFMVLRHDPDSDPGSEPQGAWRFPRLANLSTPGAFTLVTAVLTPTVAVFSVFVATYPGEWIDKNLLLRLIDRYSPILRIGDQTLALSDALFRGPVNEVVGKPRSLFSNVLVVPDANFDDVKEDKDPAKTRRRFSLRGRDLRGAVLVRADLHLVDFTGANLGNARLDGAKLDGAVFGCGQTGLTINPEGRPIEVNPAAAMHWPRDGCTWLVGASLNRASLLGAKLDNAKLQGASLQFAQLMGASLVQTDLSAAQLDFANLQGASLDSAILTGASMRFAQLQGAYLGIANDPVSRILNRTADFGGASLDNAYVWRTRRDNSSSLPGSLLLSSLRRNPSTSGTEKMPRFRLSSLANWSTLNFSPDAHYEVFRARPLAPDEPPLPEAAAKQKAFNAWIDTVLKPIADPEIRAQVRERLSILDPHRETIADVIDEKDWAEVEQRRPKGTEYEIALKNLIWKVACEKIDNAPYVIRGLIRSKRIADTGEHLPELAALIRQADKCPGAKGLTEDDFSELRSLLDRPK